MKKGISAVKREKIKTLNATKFAAKPALRTALAPCLAHSFTFIVVLFNKVEMPLVDYGSSSDEEKEEIQDKRITTSLPAKHFTASHVLSTRQAGTKRPLAPTPGLKTEVPRYN